MTTISDLQHALAKRDLEWDPEGKLTLEFRATELAGECGEACNIVKKLCRERLGLRGSRATVTDLKDELEDVIICVGLLANAAGIQLNVADKFNASSTKLGLNVFL